MPILKSSRGMLESTANPPAVLPVAPEAILDADHHFCFHFFCDFKRVHQQLLFQGVVVEVELGFPRGVLGSVDGLEQVALDQRGGLAVFGAMAPRAPLAPAERVVGQLTHRPHLSTLGTAAGGHNETARQLHQTYFIADQYLQHSNLILEYNQAYSVLFLRLIASSFLLDLFIKPQYNSKPMERYSQKSATLQGSNRTAEQRKLQTICKRKPKIKHLLSKGERGSNINLNTIDVSIPTDLRIQFAPEEGWVDKGTPGVGEYDISSPFVRPSYETYEKSDQVILVKINHIGGTSSFRSEGQRFLDGSIYHPSASPGPGAYQLASHRTKKHLSTAYHENYALIQELLRNSRERTESMPNYKIGVPQPGLEYNGLPKHLQEIYMNMNRAKESTSTVKSLPLEKLIKLRKRTQKLPIVEKRNGQAFATTEKKRCVMDKMTETLYRLDEQLKRQEERNSKMRAFLKPSYESKSKSIDHQPDTFSGRARRQMAFNKNMVNILFERAGK